MGFLMRNRLFTAFVLLFAGVSFVLAQGSSACFVDYKGGFYEPWLAYGGGTAWKKGSAITLYIVSPTSGGFTSGQITNIETALSNWSSSAGSNLQITNSVVTSAAACLLLGTCSPPYPPQYILVQFGSVADCPAGSMACTAANYNTTTGFPTYSIINVSTSIGTMALGPLMAHEVGHTYLMADCPEAQGCSDSLTVMVVPTDPTGPTSPACCDLDLIYFVTNPPIQQGAICK
jgi:hypothetical protein